MTSQIDIDCRHYGDRELGTARPVDINDHQESTERHRQRGNCKTWTLDWTGLDWIAQFWTCTIRALNVETTGQENIYSNCTISR